MTNPIEHKDTYSAVCPHCGHEYLDSWELMDGNEYDCVECGKSFTLIVELVAYYSTTKV